MTLTKDINRELALRGHDREADFFKTNNDAAIKSGEGAIKALILINGGSSVAMLTFVGTLASKEQYTSQQIAVLAHALICFASGVGLAVLAACFSYVTNMAIASLLLTRVRMWEYPYVKDGRKAGVFRYLRPMPNKDQRHFDNDPNRLARRIRSTLFSKN